MVTVVSTDSGSSMSPVSATRLPSPPPFPEVQTAPKSPAATQDDGNMVKPQICRRVRPGTKAGEMAKGPPLVPLSEEYLKALHHKESHNEEGDTRAITKTAAVRLATAPDGVERSLWLYELCRLLIARVNTLIVGFFNDNPKCCAANCPEMRASEWQYLCAVHDPPKSCCAIDYCCHTLDWATNIITSQKHFPSRLTLGGDGGASQHGIRQLTNIFRRVYRMFAHAWFQHRDVFWQVESTEGLYIFYKTVCEVYSLMPSDTYTVPPEAETALSSADETASTQTLPTQQELPLRPKVTREGTVLHVKDGLTSAPSLMPATAKRHKHNPSTGSFVLPISEDDEDSETSTEQGDFTDFSSQLSTVRYDPKDLQSGLLSTEDDKQEGGENGIAGQKQSDVTEIHSQTSSDDGKSPVTPIDDEPSPEEETTIELNEKSIPPESNAHSTQTPEAAQASESNLASQKKKDDTEETSVTE